MSRLTEFAQTHQSLEDRLFLKMINRRLNFEIRDRARRAYHRLTDYKEVAVDKYTLNWVISKNRFCNDIHNAPLCNARKYYWTKQHYLNAGW